jgi:hypothetical protein
LNIKKGLGSLNAVFIKAFFSISLEIDWAGGDGLDAHNFYARRRWFEQERMAESASAGKSTFGYIFRTNADFGVWVLLTH